MAVNLSTALAPGQNGFVPDESGLVKEEITVTGSSSSANDTGTYTTMMKQPQYAAVPNCSYTISGQVVTLTDEVGLGSAKTGGTVYGYP
jgi:hypothetical protein